MSILYADTVVYTSSDTQKCIALSSTEAENVAVSDAVKVVPWLRQMRSEVNITQCTTTSLQDRQGVM